ASLRGCVVFGRTALPNDGSAAFITTVNAPLDSADNPLPAPPLMEHPARMANAPREGTDRVQNVEFKAELRDLELARAIAHRAGARPVHRMWQTDTYYKLADGRLKRREIEIEGESNQVEYIFYHRDNASRARVSRFTIYSEAEALTRFGSLTLPIWVVVRKQRDLYMLEWTRIHLDLVDRLGTFIEFESMVSPKNTEAMGFEAVRRLREIFGPILGEPLSCSYSDLLAQEPEPTHGAGPIG
ncbi:MAG: class IV adenylate cyclase, partial [Phycisphaerales bacterium]